MDDSRLNSFFNCYIGDFVGDVANVNYNKYSTEFLNEFKPQKDVFCDNIVIRRPANMKRLDDKNFLDKIGYIRLIYNVLKDIGFLHFNISFLGLTYDVNNYLEEYVHENYSEIFYDDDYIPGYASLKVSLSVESFKDVLTRLKLHQKRLHHDFIFVYNIDITQDCVGSFSRAEIVQFLLLKNVKFENILNNVKKVGNNCLSWYMLTSKGIKIRFTIYNKFVQMLESHEVRSYIGSRISAIAANSSTLKDFINFSKFFGWTRFEIRVNYDIIYKYGDYISLIDEFFLFMKGCKVYKTSFEHQWKALVDDIENMNVLAIYVSNRKIFAYCHWYNSLTSKKQGSIRQNINETQIPTLLTNYSFNTGKIRYIKVEDNGLGYVVISTSQYQRIKKGITLVPGINNSLNPQRRKIDPSILSSFADIGLIEYKGIHLEWPFKTKTLSEIEEIVDNDRLMKNIVSVNNREYRYSHLCLSRNTTYKVVAMRFGKYRNKNVVYVILHTDKNMNKIRTKFGEHGLRLFTHIDTNYVFNIKTGNFIYNLHNHIADIEVFLD